MPVSGILICPPSVGDGFATRWGKVCESCLYWCQCRDGTQLLDYFAVWSKCKRQQQTEPEHKLLPSIHSRTLDHFMSLSSTCNYVCFRGMYDEVQTPEYDSECLCEEDAAADILLLIIMLFFLRPSHLCICLGANYWMCVHGGWNN